MKKLVSAFEVPPKVQSGDQSRRQNLRVTDSTLRVFPMIQGFQQIVTKAVNEYNLKVHRGSAYRGVVEVLTTLANPDGSCSVKVATWVIYFSFSSVFFRVLPWLNIMMAIRQIKQATACNQASCADRQRPESRVRR